MKAITLYQPWASLVASGAKKIETRSWSTDYRGKLAIHVAKNKDVHAYWNLKVEPFLSAMNKILIDYRSPEEYSFLLQNFHYGCIIAVCDLIDCLPAAHVKQAFGKLWIKGSSGVSYQIHENEPAFGDFSAGRFLWVLSNIEKFENPIPARGNRRLWDWWG